MKNSCKLQVGAGGRPLAAPCLFTLLLALLLGPASAFAQSPDATLLTTFTNPVPANYGLFGISAAALGSDRVLIGAAGHASLFSLTGTLLTTFTPPDPAAGYFGVTLAAVGSDRVLIGAYAYTTTGAQTGRAYLLSTSGTLITTFANPNPARVCCIGESVAALGSDRVLIGAHADPNAGAPYLGAAYLFRTNGTLLTTFTNPTPTISIYFGVKVAAVGSDRVLISAEASNIGAPQAGVAYLYTTNGTLLTTITNPVPTAGDSFGYFVAALGSDRVLISAAGAAKVYLFSLSGTLITTFTSPSPTAGDNFGNSVAAVGSDRVIIGATYNDTGAQNAGSAYLFDLPYPPMSIAKNAATVSLKWVTPETGLALQQAGALGSPTAWSNTSDSVSINGLTNVVQQTMTTTNRFFRLHRP